MNLTPQTLAREAAATGFDVEPLEKVFRLMALLDALNSHPFLKTRIALKGGTALTTLSAGTWRFSALRLLFSNAPLGPSAISTVCSL